MPQGGPLSVVCSNVYLDKLDKELEERGHRFTRYADDVLIFTKSEMAANRVMKLSEYLKRGKAVARPLAVMIKRVNETVRGWINYFRIGMMKQFMEEFGEWLRHKIRVIVMKQWKSPKTIYRNLCYLNWKQRNGFNHEEI